MSADREALVSMLAGAGVWLDRCPEIADTILESDWLTAHVVQEMSMMVDAWQTGGWLHLPVHSDPMQQKIAGGQFVTDWFRGRIGVKR